MRKNLKSLIALLLSAVIVASVAACDTTEVSSNPTVSSSSSSASSVGGEITPTAEGGSVIAVEELKTQYGVDTPYDVIDTLKDIPLDTGIEIASPLDPVSFGKETNFDAAGIAEIFIDKDLSVSAGAYLSYDATKQAYVFKPPVTPILPTISEDSSQQAALKGQYPWGIVDTYYLVEYYDMQTGEELAKPAVTIFSFENELAAPIATAGKSDNGYMKITWTEVPEAEQYHVVMLGSIPVTVGQNLTGTEFVYEDMTLRGNSQIMNLLFEGDNSLYQFVCVYAQNGDQISASNLIPVEDFKSYLVYSMGNSYLRYDKASELPAHANVRMVDGRQVAYPITFDLENAGLTTIGEALGYENSSISNPDEVIMRVPFSFDNLPLSFFMIVNEYDYPEFEADLAKRIEELESQKGKAGGNNEIGVSRMEDESTTSGNDIVSTPESSDVASSAPESSEAVSSTPETSEVVSSNPEGGQIISTDYETILNDPNLVVFASTPLSAYLALNMLNGEEYIDLTPFPESSDTQTLLDSFYEAYYQNPLILGIDGIGVSYDGTIFAIQYSQDREEQLTKQKEILAKVEDVVGEVVNDSMSDVEKEIALNNFLIEWGEYDYAVLEIAMENDMQVSNEYRDTFSAYGILIDQLGVCASYASSYKLLADAAGLDSIVVTGYLNGNLAHAWNRVNLDGQWLTVDVTNNDNADLYNSILNISDDTAALMLVEDTLYLNDSLLSQVSGTSDDYEYYRLNSEFYPVDEIGGQLATLFLENGTATLRTTSGLTNEDFETIVLGMAQAMPDEESLNQLLVAEVYENLGVITIKTPQ